MDREKTLRFMRFFSKFCVASIVAGIILSQMQFKPDSFFSEIGISTDEIINFIVKTFEWIIPHFTVGAMFVVPLWLLIHLFRPPKN